LRILINVGGSIVVSTIFFLSAVLYSMASHVSKCRFGTSLDEPKTLVESAYIALRRDIIEGRFTPGEKLRVEHIRADYEVGASTLREALSLLLSDGLVVLQGQRGFSVAEMSLEDFRDITETRVLLECAALKDSLALGDDEWESNLIAAFHRLSKAEEKFKKSSNREEWEARNRIFHEVLISASPSRLIKEFISLLYQQAERYRRQTMSSKAVGRDVHAEHEALFRAAMSRDIGAATKLLTDHIRATLAVYEGMCYAKKGK